MESSEEEEKKVSTEQSLISLFSLSLLPPNRYVQWIYSRNFFFIKSCHFQVNKVL